MFAAGQGAADVVGGVGSFAAGLAVVDFHLAEVGGGGESLLFQGIVADADGNQGVVHGIPDPVLADVDFAFDGCQAGSEIVIREVLVLQRQVGYQVPAGASWPFTIGRAPMLGLVESQGRLAHKAGKGVGKHVVVQLVGPSLQQRITRLGRVGDHSGQHPSVVVASGPKLEGQVLVTLDGLGQLVLVGIAYAEHVIADAVAAVDLAILGGAEGFQLLHCFLKVHLNPLTTIRRFKWIPIYPSG